MLSYSEVNASSSKVCFEQRTLWFRPHNFKEPENYFPSTFQTFEINIFKIDKIQSPNSLHKIVFLCNVAVKFLHSIKVENIYGVVSLCSAQPQ